MHASRTKQKRNKEERKNDKKKKSMEGREI